MNEGQPVCGAVFNAGLSVSEQMTNEEPLIWTSKGNLPVAQLGYAARWEVGADCIKLVETYKLGDEVVKESAHICVLRGESLAVEQAALS